MYFSAPTDELIIRHVVRETVFEDEDLLLFDQNDIEPLIEQWDCVHRDDRSRFREILPNTVVTRYLNHLCDINYVCLANH